MWGLATTTVAIAFAAGGAPGAAADSPLDREAAAQIAALQALKRSQTGAERKLDSRLAVAARRQAGRARLARAPEVDPGVDVRSSGRTEVDVHASAVGDDLLDRLKLVGAQVRHASTRVDSIRAAIPLAALDEVAGWRDVRRVELAAEAMTQQGATVSEGDTAHAADLARARHLVTGTGVKLCALSDGVRSLAASQAAGELPAVDVLPGQAGSGDEGTAMLQILHDLAPKAALGFATAFTSDASFAENIRALRFQAACDVIVDDVIYFNEHPFQDGPIARSVDAVTADGALYFSSAGNAGNVLDGTSGNYEGDFVPSGRGVAKFAGDAHDFDPGPGVQVFEPISPESAASKVVTLFWADPLGASANDYDLYLLDGNSNVVAFSQSVQDGDDDPYERVDTPARGGTALRLAVVKFAGADRYFQLSALRSRFEDSADGLVAYTSPGVTRGHSAAVDAFSTAAAPAAAPYPTPLEPGDPPNPLGPFPSPFTSAQLPERFTSDGPRRVFFAADGTPVTPGDFSSSGGAVRQKPDITAADGVTTTVPGFARFFGTSAAAPHAAAIAGLVLSGNPGLRTADVREAFSATASDLVPSGVDGRTGAGVIRADAVLDYTGATPQPLVRASAPSVTPVSGDGDAYLEPGETAALGLPVVNEGDGTATGVSVTVSTTDAGVRLTPRAQSYGSVAPGQTAERTFQLELAPDHPLGRKVHLNVRVTFAGVLSPTTAGFDIATGQPADAPTTFAYAGPPLAIPDNVPAGASVELPVTGIGYAAELTFSIDGTACTREPGAVTVGLDHTFVGDLVATLTAPDGRSVRLMDRDGGGGDNVCQAVFDDAATRPFAEATPALAPFTGSWRPYSSLDALLSAPVDGRWTFHVVDAAPRDVGSIRAVSLHVTDFVEG
jgi:subtilisin-like proprotein convertase family protein